MTGPAEGGALTHVDAHGRARMVEVGDKPETQRGAIAAATVRLSPASLAMVAAASGHKGDTLQVARIAAIMAAKRCSELIPLCHPVRLVAVEVEFELDAARNAIDLRVRAQAVDRTGVEMEAMTAAAVGALTIYDMIKSVDRGACIESVHLLEKWGGRSGHFVAEP